MKKKKKEKNEIRQSLVVVGAELEDFEMDNDIFLMNPCATSVRS